MNQRAVRLLLGGAILLLGGCSDDDGSDTKPKDPNAQAGSGGGGAAGMGGSGGVSGSGGGGTGGSTDPGDAGMEDTCTPVFLDAGVVVSDAGSDAGDAGDAGAVPSNGAVTFSVDIHPIFRANCVPCHETIMSGGHNVAAVDVNEAYSYVKDIKGVLLSRVNGGNMPPDCLGVPGDPNCISVAELNLIERWAAQCFPF